MAKTTKSKESTATIKIMQVKSAIRRPKDQSATLVGLRLNKLNRVSELKKTPEVLGMIKKVAHLVKVIN